MAKKKSTKKLTENKKTPKSSTVSKSPKKKSTKKITKKSNIKVSSTKSSLNFYDQLKLGDSYVSLILGAAVVVGVFVIFFAYVKESRNVVANERVLHASVSPTRALQPKNKTYVLQDGESLWDVAVKFYGDGYKYTVIVNANNFTDPEDVPPGTKILIPNAQ
jgi:nucleoid-associated protein YgaU